MKKTNSKPISQDTRTLKVIDPSALARTTGGVPCLEYSIVSGLVTIFMQLTN